MKKNVILVLCLLLCFYSEFNIFHKMSIQKNNFDIIDTYEFNQKLESKDEFIMYFFKDDCLPCINFKPTLNKVIDDYRLNIYAINLSIEMDSFDKYMKEFSIFNTPTLIIFEDGIEKKRYEGSMPEATLVEFLDCEKETIE